MIDWYRNLQQRERWLVLIAAVGVLLTLYFLLVFEPLVQARQQALKRHAAALSVYQSLLETRQQVTTLRQGLASQRPKVAPDRLLGLIDQRLRAAGIDKALNSIKPEPAGGVRLRFDDVNFDQLIRWLGAMRNQSGVGIDVLSVTETARAGRVKASLLLK